MKSTERDLHKKRLFLVDASSFIFRAFYAVRHLTNPAGMPVNAIYGYLSMLVKLIKDEKPDLMVLCMDRKEPSFRKKLYELYKANRTEMPTDLEVQMPYIKKCGNLLGITSVEVPDYEADDVIGTLAQLGLKNNYEVIIVSGDKDFAQLVQPHVTLFDSMKNQKIQEKEVTEKWKVFPNQMIDYFAIVGDSSDHIPGVPGLGPKAAEKLINEFQNLENIYKNIDSIKPLGVQEKLKTHKELAFLSKKLVTIEQHIPLQWDEKKFHLHPYKKQELIEFLNELNFKTFIKSLGLDSIEQLESKTESLAEQNTEGHFNQPRAKIELITHQEINEAFSLEDKIWAWSKDNYFYVSSQRTQKIFLIKDPEKFGMIADQKSLKWYGYDLKKIWHLAKVKNPIYGYDLMLAHYSQTSEDCSNEVHILEAITEKPIPLDHSTEYLKTLEEAYQRLEEKFSNSRLLSVYKNYDAPLARVLYQMEVNGIKVNRSYLTHLGEEFNNEMEKAEKKIHELSGEKFNVASPKQLSKILFEKLELPAIKKTKTGFSTDNEVLESLNHPVAQWVLSYREVAKLKSTYVDSLIHLADSFDRVHTHFNQALTATGRLSSTDPNLQNIPIRTENGQKVRRAFISDPGFLLVSIDYSQIELRILAHITSDPGLCYAFANNQDIHASTASEIFNVKLTDVSDEQRRIAKAINFGIAYGQGAFGLAGSLGISKSESSDIIERYFQRFPGVKDYIESTKVKAHDQGYVETLFGRRRYLPELKSKNPMIKKFGERAAINAPIQGTSSDLVKKAMIDVFNEIPWKMILQVHDELVFEVPESEVNLNLKKVKNIMENVIRLNVPLVVNESVGKHWL